MSQDGKLYFPGFYAGQVYNITKFCPMACSQSVFAVLPRKFFKNGSDSARILLSSSIFFLL